MARFIEIDRYFCSLHFVRPRVLTFMFVCVCVCVCARTRSRARVRDEEYIRRKRSRTRFSLCYTYQFVSLPSVLLQYYNPLRIRLYYETYVGVPPLEFYAKHVKTYTDQTAQNN